MSARALVGAGSVLHKNAYRVSVALVILLGIWLRWPSLYNGFFSDDMTAVAMVKGVYASPRAPLDLFNFTDGTPQDHARLMRYGSLPWWTADHLRMAMMRPLASALILVDQRLFGKHALPYHVHSMVWWVALMLAAAGLFNDLFTVPVASAALLLFALEEGHTFTLGWIANRGALIAMVFCLLGLRAHLRWRRAGVRRAAYISSLCFALALLSGEWAFPLMGYVFAFELVGSTGTWRSRALALLPSALPSLVFAAVRARLGYGALNSGVYTDPLSEPLRFVFMIGERMPVFFADMVFSIPANYWVAGSPWRDQLLGSGLIPPDIWIQLPGWTFWHFWIGIAAMLTVGLTLWAVLPARPANERRELYWLLLGALLSLLPMVSSFPHGRMVLPAALAFAPASAIVLHECARRLRRHWRRRSRGGVLLSACMGALLVYFQVWQAGSRSYDEARGTPHFFAAIRRLLVDAELDTTRIEDKRVVVLGVIEHTAMVFAPYVRWVFGQRMPRSWWTLTAAPYAHDIYRPAPNVLEMSTLGGPMLKSSIEQLYRAERFGMHVGDRIEIDGLRIEIMRMLGDFPQTVRFIFDKSVDDPSYVFLFSGPEGLGPARLPEVGGRVRYRRPSFGDTNLQNILRAVRDPNVACIGPRPPLNECRIGFAFADCGGRGGPVLGCTWQNDCRWFLHGCVSEGYDTSSCQPGNVCCQNGWPFETDSFTRDTPYVQRLSESLYGWGHKAFDVAADFVIDVPIDTGLETRAPEVRCQGPYAERGPCGLGLVDVADPQPESLYFVFRGERASDGWALTVEMVEDSAGERHARVCRVAMPPIWTEDPAARSCPVAVVPVCAQRGSLVLNKFPIYEGMMSQLRARLDVDFPDGLHVDAEL
jgi:hypothetical protein